MDGYNFVTKPVAHPRAVVKGDKWRLSVLADGLVRCEWADDGRFEDRASTFAINRELPVPKFRVVDKGDVLDIFSDRFHLTYDKKPFSSSGLAVNVLSKVTDHKSRWRYPNFEGSLGGTARTLDGVDGRCEVGPGIPSRNGFSALNDSDSMLFEGTDWVAGRRSGNREDVYVFTYGTDYKDAMKTYFAVSGSQPEVPRWSLGNWWSRYHAYSEQSYLDLMDRFKNAQIPLSIAVLDMDWHLVADERVSHSGWTGYTWDKKLFPDPPAFLEKLHSLHLRVTANDHPAEGVHSFEDVYESMAKEMNFDTSNEDPLQFDSTNPVFLKAYLNMWRSLKFDFCWIDWQQGTSSRIPGLDPLWLLNHYHFIDNGRINTKPMIFSRYAGPGSHRYPVGFSGDSAITWGSLQFQPEFTALASNIGFGWWSHHIGGHFFGGRDDEMATRWIQLGVYSPMMRLHSTQNKWMSKEPWLYNKESEEAIAKVMRFRHRLIPYLHTMNVRSARKDEPLVQPIYWQFSTRDEAYRYPNSFFFGSQLLVAPITTPRSSVTSLGGVKTWLPPSSGKWVDIFSGQVYDGDRTLTMWRSLAEVPVLAQEGAIVPLDANLLPGNGALNPESLELLVVPGADAEFTIIEDVADDQPHTSAGSDVRPVPGQERNIKVKWRQSEQKLTVEYQQPGAERTRNISVLLVGVVPTASELATLEAEVKVLSGPGEFLRVELPSNSGVELKGLKAVPRDGKLEQRLEHLLNAYQTKFSLKDSIWAAATSKKPVSTKVSELTQIEGASDELIGPVLELLLADSRTE